MDVGGVVETGKLGVLFLHAVDFRHSFFYGVTNLGAMTFTFRRKYRVDSQICILMTRILESIES